MKNKIWFTLNLLLLLAILSFSGARAMPVVQTSGLASNSFGVSPTFTLANCETTVVPGFTTFCPIWDRPALLLPREHHDMRDFDGRMGAGGRRSRHAKPHNQQHDQAAAGTIHDHGRGR